MALEFFLGSPRRVARVAALPGTFNPPTVAHLALARAALAVADVVVFVLPRAFPHKPYAGAPFEDRVRMLLAAAAGEPRFAVAASAGGLFVEIARECVQAFPAPARPAILCGRDAAERIVNWDYGEPGAFARMLHEFELLVAARGGAYTPPPGYARGISSLDLPGDLTAVSATEVRARIAAGEPFEHLLPPGVAPFARRLYLPAT